MSIAMEDWLPRHRITVDEYHRMGELGLFAPDARVELIEGEIIDMAPIGMAHASACDWLNKRLVLATQDRAIVRCQGPVDLSRWSEPVPDFAVLAPRMSWYADAHPVGPDTLLVIEVSDSTLRYDRKIKAPLYARHRVPEVWIVDIAHHTMHFYRSRTETGYADVTSSDAPGTTLVPIPGGDAVEIDLSELLSLVAAG